MTHPDLSGCTAEETVKAAIADHAAFKAAAVRLDALPPSEGAARILVEAYQSGAAPPWLVACLLGYAKHPVGYPVARKILLDHPGSAAKSYAGVAMASTGGGEALAELKRLLMEGEHHQTRQGAWWGLGKYDTPEMIDVFASAVRAKRIPQRHYFFSIVARLRPGDQALEEWLTDSDDNIRRFGVRIVEQLLWDTSAPRPGGRVLHLVKELVAREHLRFRDRSEDRQRPKEDGD